MKETLSCKKDSKGNCDFQPIRHRSVEDPERGLIRWYGDKYKNGYIASFFEAKSEGDRASIRVCVPKGCDEIIFPFARELKEVPEDEFKKMAIKWWKELDKYSKHKWNLI